MNPSRQFFMVSLTIIIIIIIIIIITFLATGTVAREETYLFHFCIDRSGNFTRNSSYEANLNRLVSSFSSSNLAPNDYGFYNISSGQGSDAANALALCRGDVNPVNCLSCINDATSELRSLCPNQKEAIIWYDNCMFRYANRTIFGVMETGPGFYMWNRNNVTVDVDAFSSSLSALMDSLASNASTGNSRRKFATGSARIMPFQTIYALVQCTPDLAQPECSSCLSQAIQQILYCCDRKQGGRVIRPSCNFRFEIYRFYHNLTNDGVASPPSLQPQSPLSPPPSNNTTSTTTGKKSNSTRNIIIITVSTVAFALLLISISIFFFLRVRRGSQRKLITQ